MRLLIFFNSMGNGGEPVSASLANYRVTKGCANMPPSIITLYAVGLGLADTTSLPKIVYDAGQVWFRSAE